MRDENIMEAVQNYMLTAEKFGMTYEIDNDPKVDTMRLLEEIMNRIMRLEENAE